jgi:hypothetical protein
VDFGKDTEAFIQPDEVGTAAEKYVLAVIDDLADPRMQIGGCTR